MHVVCIIWRAIGFWILFMLGMGAYVNKRINSDIPAEYLLVIFIYSWLELFAFASNLH